MVDEHPARSWLSTGSYWSDAVTDVRTTSLIALWAAPNSCASRNCHPDMCFSAAGWFDRCPFAVLCADFGVAAGFDWTANIRVVPACHGFDSMAADPGIVMIPDAADADGVHAGGATVLGANSLSEVSYTGVVSSFYADTICLV